MLTETITTPEFVPFCFPDEPVIKYKKLKAVNLRCRELATANSS